MQLPSKTVEAIVAYFTAAGRGDVLDELQNLSYLLVIKAPKYVKKKKYGPGLKDRRNVLQTVVKIVFKR